MSKQSQPDVGSGGEAGLPRSPKPSAPGGVLFGLTVTMVVWLVGLIAEHLLPEVWKQADLLGPESAAAYGLLVFAAILGIGTSLSWRRRIITAHFGTAVLLAAAFATGLGTLVLQGQSPEAFEHTYGSAAGVLELLRWRDIFHSLPFGGLTGLTCASLVLVVLTRRPRTMRTWGAVLSHLGIVIVCAGAAIGVFHGIKGKVSLREGQSARSFVATYPPRLAGQKLPLGFKLTLEEFELLSYEAKVRLQVVNPHADPPRLVANVDPAEERAQVEEALSGVGVKLADYWPDHRQQLVVEPAEGEKAGPPALELRAPGPGELGGAWLFATGRAKENSIPPHGQGPRLVFHWDESAAQAWAERLTSGAAEEHIVKLDGDKEVAVTPGKSYPLAAGGSFLVVQAFKDFMFDTNTRKAAERSDEPNNPALEVVLRDEQGEDAGRRFLFSGFPDFHGSERKGPGGSMGYSYRGGEKARSQEWVAVGESKELWRIEGGKVAEKKELAAGTRFSLGEQLFEVASLHRSARASKKDVSTSEEPKNPVALIELQGGKRRYLSPGNPVRLGGSLVLRLFKQEEPKDFLSTLSAVAAGMPEVRKRIEVNDPLVYGGLSLYQSDYDPRDLTLSGFQVVRDPGLWLAYGGLLLSLLGVSLVLVAGSPLRLRNRAEQRAEEEAPKSEEVDHG
jgi:hypothetical protein